MTRQEFQNNLGDQTNAPTPTAPQPPQGVRSAHYPYQDVGELYPQDRVLTEPQFQPGYYQPVPPPPLYYQPQPPLSPGQYQQVPPSYPAVPVGRPAPVLPGYPSATGEPHPGAAYPLAYYRLPETTPSPLPEQPREYFNFYRAPAFRAWKPAVSLASVVVGGFLIMLIVLLIAIAALGLDWLKFTEDWEVEGTLELFAVNNISIMACIPLAVVLHRFLFGQQVAYLFSITGKFRWGLFGRFLLIIIPFELAIIGYELFTEGPDDLVWQPNGVSVILVIVFTTPFQAAAEEIVFRGLVFRSIGSWFSSPLLGLGVAGLTQGLFFMVLHGAGDIWLNIFYLTFGLLAAVLVWRTGGLEAAIGFHIIHNLAAEAFMPFSDLADMFNREAGVGSVEVLVPLGICLGAAALLVWLANRMGLPVASSAADKHTPHAYAEQKLR